MRWSANRGEDMAGKRSFGHGASLLLAACMGFLPVHTGTAAANPLCDPHPNGRFVNDKRLSPCENNTWYSYNKDSDTVFVFVHGILSNSRSAWFHQDASNPRSETYWPELVRTDSRFGNPSIFIGGYYTEVLGGIYDIRAAANDLFDALIAPSTPDKQSVLQKKNIVFVAHSMGGIVVRHLLSRSWNTHVFQDKAIGLVLVASPSIGSKDADRVNMISRLIPALGVVQNKMVEQLQFYGGFLTELDKDFRTMRERKVLPFMTGIEFIESRFIVPWLRQAQIVTAESAARYFDEGHPIGGTDHSTIAKPTSAQSSANLKLATFFEGAFKAQILAAQKARPPTTAILMDSYAKIYERRPIPGKMNSHVIQRVLSRLPIDANSIEPVFVNWNGDDRIAEKHPDLIIIHYSSLETGVVRGENATARLSRFLEHVLRRTSKTQIIVYSRIVDDDKRIDMDALVRRTVPEGLRGRVHGFPVYAYGGPYHTFNNAKVADELRQRVVQVLKLPN